MAEFVKAASINEIAPGQARLVTVKGKEIVLFNIEGAFFALENACHVIPPRCGAGGSAWPRPTGVGSFRAGA